MDLENRISALVAPSLDAMGYELVRVLIQGRQRLVLQIMAERKDRQGMTVDDCAAISRALSAVLDVDDPIDKAYTLEVSSPGIDRPLTRPADFTRFAGHLARLETTQLVDGHKRFSGRILGLEDEAVRLALDNGSEIALPLAVLAKARLVLTDALIAAAQAETSNATP